MNQDQKHLEFPHGPLVSSQWLAENLDHPRLVILDVRGQWKGNPPSHRDEYESSHIPHAIFVDWTQEFVDTESPIELAPVAAPQKFSNSAAKYGINRDSLVVCYDEVGYLATRIWWGFRYYGHSQVRVLDGGWKNWTAEGRPVTNQIPEVSLGNFETKSPVKKLRIEVEEVQKKLKEQAFLLDARGVATYSGNADDPRSGHIPGAVNLPFSELVDGERGKYKTPKEIRKMLEDKELNLDSPPAIITTCGSGYVATMALLALELVGLSAGMYEGSFSEWKQDPQRPVKQGGYP